MVWAIFYSGDDARSSWLPEGRVLEFIEETGVTVESRMNCLLVCNNISISEFSNFFKNAKVNFKESTTSREPCPVYKIEGKLSNGSKITVFIETCEPRRLSSAEEKEGVATLIDFSFEGINVNCNC
ncbi:MAG: hypothetical protein CVT95_12225 [Bacteroidetes bacterium HGW-Bacteroidetes-12]|nr:MAG: hypothetical protein CVT95_12225 [Bacteroidetes bacterium HGW-Bacteroidetes-12]